MLQYCHFRVLGKGKKTARGESKSAKKERRETKRERRKEKGERIEGA